MIGVTDYCTYCNLTVVDVFYVVVRSGMVETFCTLQRF